MYYGNDNSYIHLLEPLYMFLPLLRDLHQTSTEHFVKLAVVHDLWAVKLPLPLALPYQNMTGSCKESST